MSELLLFWRILTLYLAHHPHLKKIPQAKRSCLTGKSNQDFGEGHSKEATMVVSEGDSNEALPAPPSQGTSVEA